VRTKAAVLTEMGLAAPYATSRPLEIEELELAALERDDVLIEIAAAGLCHSDLSVIDGTRPRPLPMVLGHEAAGIVREVGANVGSVAAGDHVVFSFVPMCGHCAACSTRRPVLCENGARANGAGMLLGGGRRFARRSGLPVAHHLGVSAFSQYTIASEHSLIRIPSDVPLEKAALFGCAVVTGVGAVLNAAAVRPGSATAIFGLGGVGLSAIMGAQLAGADPIIAVDVIPAKLELARKVGATHALNAATSEPAAAIKDLTHGGVDFAIEAVGSASVLAQAYLATARGGTTVTVGLPHPDQRFDVAAVGLVAEERTVKGSYMGSSDPRRDVPRYLSLYRAGRLPVDALFSGAIPLEEINSGFDRLAAGNCVRQVVRFG
jgi:alcohol dehydrogenase